MDLSLFKLIMYFVKYYVIFSSFIMTLHCGLLISGVDLWITDLFVGVSIGGYICMFITSFVLKLCNLFRSFLTHQFFVSSCISLQSNIGFDELLLPLRTIAFIIGILLLVILIYRTVKSIKNIIKKLDNIDQNQNIENIS